MGLGGAAMPTWGYAQEASSSGYGSYTQQPTGSLPAGSYESHTYGKCQGWSVSRERRFRHTGKNPGLAKGLEISEQDLHD